MKKLLLSGLATAVFAISGSAMAANFVAGQDYIVVPTPVQVEVPGKIEVREFFWYGCGHCFKLEPHMQTWLKKLPKDVRFVRTPAAMNPVWEQAARAYYESFAITSKIAQAQDLAKRYQLSGVPAVTVNGKYIVQGEDAKVTQVVDYLIEKERAAK